MSRRTYISCLFEERGLLQVESLCKFIHPKHGVVEFAPYPEGSWDFYHLLEDAIERCDAFVAIVGNGYSSSTWLNHELGYAYALNKYRFQPRPRLFGVCVDGHELPKCSEHIRLEWLHDEAGYQLILDDLQEKK